MLVSFQWAAVWSLAAVPLSKNVISSLYSKPVWLVFYHSSSSYWRGRWCPLLSVFLPFIQLSFVFHNIDIFNVSLMECSVLVSIFANCWWCAASYFHLLQAATLTLQRFHRARKSNQSVTGTGGRRSPRLRMKSWRWINVWGVKWGFGMLVWEVWGITWPSWGEFLIFFLVFITAFYSTNQSSFFALKATYRLETSPELFPFHTLQECKNVRTFP